MTVNDAAQFLSAAHRLRERVWREATPENISRLEEAINRALSGSRQTTTHDI